MKTWITVASLLMLVACDGHYRYPCQDPENWGKDECNNEACKAEGECTADVLGSDEKPSFADYSVEYDLNEYTTQNDCTGE